MEAVQVLTAQLQPLFNKWRVGLLKPSLVSGWILDALTIVEKHWDGVHIQRKWAPIAYDRGEESGSFQDSFTVVGLQSTQYFSTRTKYERTITEHTETVSWLSASMATYDVANMIRR